MPSKIDPSEELRRAATKVNEDLWFPADLAHLRQPIVQMLRDSVVPWERIEWQNSRPGEARTRVCPNEMEAAALKLAQAINEGCSR
jgi:hypothetical protein